jgi:sulfate transport system ATP-binding protein
MAVRNVSKRFGNFVALDDVSVDIPGGALLALLGPSGSGKTTLLRIIAGLETPDSGTVLYHDEDATRRSARERNVGFVFQHYALFRHLNVYENIAFGLRVRRWSDVRVRARVGELLDLIQLGGLEKRLPGQLSGGQRQRVALARALAPEPKVLLLDEPFGALDAKVRQELRRWLRRLHDEIAVTSVFVTHDQEEAFEVADRVVVMQAGKVVQIGSPMEVFEHPANAFVMKFLGNVNVFPCQVRAGMAFVGSLGFPCPGHVDADASTAKLYIRPHELELSRDQNHLDGLPARVVHLSPGGSAAKVQLRAEGLEDIVFVDLTPSRFRELCLSAGEKVFIYPGNARIFSAERPA